MKATLEFNLPEETRELSDAIDGTLYKFILQQIMRRTENRMDLVDNDIAIKELELMKENICDELEMYNLNIWD